MEFETARTVVYPWMCDSMGHFATQHYMKVFDDASYHLLGRMGYSIHDASSTRRGWADVSHQIVYRREFLAGDLVIAISSIQALGRTSLTYQSRLVRVAATNEDCAVLNGVMVHFDLDRRAAIPLPEDFRQAAASAMNT